MKKIFSSQNHILSFKELGVFTVLFFSIISIIFGNHSIALLSPLPEKVDVFDGVEAKLQARPNSYKVFIPHSFIPTAHAESMMDVSAYGLIDFDSGKVIAQNNFSKQIPIASLTKIMTAVVALDLADPDEDITITKHAADMVPTKIVVLPGEKMKLRELLYASLLTSANDATQAIADGIDAKYGEPVFIKSMNKKAELLKLKNSHFVNPEGFDNPQHYSTVEDLAVLTHYAMEYPVIADTVKLDMHHLDATATHHAHQLLNWNGLIGVYPQAFGMKIGNTDAAAFTTVVLSERAGKKMMAIVLGADGAMNRDLKAAELLDLGYQETLNLAPVNVTAQQLQAKYATWSPYL